MESGLRVVYLHGFASSPESRKARFFAEHLRQLGFKVSVPDLAEGNFRNLTLTGQLEVIAREVDSGPVALIGSSMGGYLAALFAAHHPQVRKVVLLAPAFDFCRLWLDELGPQRMAEWRRTGTLHVFHYAVGHELPLGFGLMEDACRYDPFPSFLQPALLFHGTRDRVVPSKLSIGFADSHPNVHLQLLDSEHELTDVLDHIWPPVHEFLCS
ncbi:MAG: alpha/beta fold hydrolase [Acidobacteriaceae bacterium]|nr:alpha/beta fold hydrolase [Acidobacteriaceae bacterium]